MTLNNNGKETSTFRITVTLKFKFHTYSIITDKLAIYF